MTGMTLAEFRESLRAEKRNTPYSALVRRYGVNRYWLCNIVRNPKFRPSKTVMRKLGIVARKRAPRLAISKTDPASAAAAIRRNMGDEYARKLAEELICGTP